MAEKSAKCIIRANGEDWRREKRGSRRSDRVRWGDHITQESGNRDASRTL